MTALQPPPTPQSPPRTITSTLQEIFDSVGEPLLVAALSSFAPWVGALFNMPIIGPLLSRLLKWSVDRLIARGVIEVKVGIIAYMSSEAKKQWAKEIEILDQVSKANRQLTPEEQAAYDEALQAIGRNHPGVVNS